MTDDALREHEIVEEDDRELQERAGDKFEFDAKHHAYFLNGREMTGCTTVLGVIAKPALIQWAANEAAKYIKAETIDKYPDGKMLMLERDTLTAVLDEARTAHTRKRDDAAQKGTDTHALVEEYIKDCIATKKGFAISSTGYDDLKQIEAFVEWSIKENIHFLASEEQVYSRSLFVAGTFDFMFEKDGKRYVGDLKTYKKLYDRIPIIQCAGYALMWEEMHGEAKLSDIAIIAEGMYGDADKANRLAKDRLQIIDGYCIFNLPKERAFNEAQDVLWSWDTEGDREAFISAVRLYRYLKIK